MHGGEKKSNSLEKYLKPQSGDNNVQKEIKEVEEMNQNALEVDPVSQVNEQNETVPDEKETNDHFLCQTRH